jgi:Fe2+ or Zn2+ uptake regulation protein
MFGDRRALTLLAVHVTLLFASICKKVYMHYPEDVHLLRAQGFRLTAQRQAILEIIKGQPAHFTAGTIYAVVQQQQPTIDLATVYRTLQWLQRVGLVRTIDVGKDQRYFEYARAQPHHHLICKVCGAEHEIDNHVIACLQAHILEHYDFDADPEHVAIFGRCSHCRLSMS